MHICDVIYMNFANGVTGLFNYDASSFIHTD
jgi:hypothetical protein